MAAAPSPYKRIFFSSTVHSLSQLSASLADAQCFALASNAGLGSKWKAWYSDQSQNVADRMTKSTQQYVNMQNQTIATNWSDLTDGSIQNYIRFTELGTEVNPNDYLATNSYYNGTWTGINCQYGGAISLGAANQLNSSWSFHTNYPCYSNMVARLICIEQ